MRFLVVLMLWIACVTSVARAQDDSDPLEEAAAIEYAAGERAFEEVDYQEALRHFRRALEIHDHDAIRFNIGVCMESLGRFREAEQIFARVVAGDQLDPADRTRAATLLARVRARLGEIEIRGAPSGSEALIDGDFACVIPCTARVDPGAHVVEVRSPTGARAERRIEVDRGEEASVWLDATTTAEAGGDVPSTPPEGRGLGALGWMGLGTALVGTGTATGFLIQTLSVHDDFQNMPTTDLQSEGRTFQTLTWVAAGVGLVGAALFLIDLIVFAPQPASR